VVFRTTDFFRLASVAVFACLGACSNPTKFSWQESPATLNTNMLIEGGRFATNKTRQLSVEFVNLRGEFKSMKIAHGNSAENAPVVPYSQKTFVDMNEGPQDGPQLFTAELTDVSGKKQAVQATIFLDRVPPRGNSMGALAQGQNGLNHFNFNDSVPVDVQAEDVPAANGLASGLDANPLKIAYTDMADCSLNLTEVSGWVPYNGGHFTGFHWPEKNPAKALYVCVFVQDRAGNTSTILSQPLNAPWQIIAGDNNQGNGGSVNAANVRFNQPEEIAVDSTNALYVSDRAFNTIRKVTPDGVIQAFAGNGRNGGDVQAGPATATILPGPQSIDVDSKDQIFVVVVGGIARIDKNQNIKLWIGLPGLNHLVIDRNSDTMYISHFDHVDSTQSGAYLYKIDAKKENPSASDLVVIAGNGTTERTEDAIILTGPAQSVPLALPAGLALGDDGSIYVGAQQDGNGWHIGHHGIRRISFDSNGVATSTWIDTGGQTTFHSQMVYIHKGTGLNEQKFLLQASEHGLLKIDLMGCLAPSQSCTVTAVAADNQGFSFSRGVALDRQPGGISGTIYVSDTGHSRVLKLNNDSGLSYAGKWGRDVYNSSDTIATQAMVNNPFGLASDPNGNVYFLDTLNGVLRKIDSSGKIALVSGKPGSITQIVPGGFEEVPFDQAQFFTLSFTYGYSFFLKYSPWDNSLYLADGGFAERFRQFNLSTGKVRAFAFPERSPFAFTLRAPQISETQPSITYGSVGTINPTSSRIFRMDGTPARVQTQIAGSGPLTPAQESDNALSVPSGIPRGSGYDSAGNYFFSDGGIIWKITPDGKIRQVASLGAYISDFYLLEQGGKHLFFALVDWQKVKFFGLEDGIQKNLCMPGGFLNNPAAINVASDGNLIISDTYNSRVLKYYILDANKDLVMSFCP